MAFTSQEIAACHFLAQAALQEDLDGAGDLTSQAVIPAELRGRAVFQVRAPGVVAGLPAAALVFSLVDPAVSFQMTVEDGSTVCPRDCLAVASGSVRSLLAGERTALNFLQRLSGIATQSRRYVEAVAPLPCQVLDTRKTTPGWRLLEKYAVRCGGARNHRMGLFDAILIKDNHLAALGGGPEAIPRAVAAARARVGREVPVTVEVDGLDQLDAALRCDPDIILLDNMALEVMRDAVRRRNSVNPRILLEASGGVTLATVRPMAEAGVDRISVGALTHSAPALDIALDYELT